MSAAPETGGEWAAFDADTFSAADLKRLADDLVARYCPPLRPEAVQRCLCECVAEYERASVRTFVKILVERDANEKLGRQADLARTNWRSR